VVCARPTPSGHHARSLPTCPLAPPKGPRPAARSAGDLRRNR
jgi:hypothetical protein